MCSVYGSCIAMKCVHLRAAVAALLLCAPAVHADINLVLGTSFIEKYKNRASVDAHCFVDKAHASPNSPKKDGDLHIAVRCESVNLAAVAEIMNAAEQTAAVDRVHELQGAAEGTTIAGAWRLWPEHGGSDAVNDQRHPPEEPFTTTNPDHVFEIHPISFVGGFDVRATWKPIDGYTPKDAEQAFMRYEAARFLIKPGTNYVTMSFPAVGYNYVKFEMTVLDKAVKRADGYTALAMVSDLNGDLIVRKRRMVFVDGTPPSDVVSMMSTGDCRVVLGIPRIDLELVSWRVKNSLHRPGVLAWSMPYEIIVVGVYPTPCATDQDD